MEKMKKQSGAGASAASAQRRNRSYVFGAALAGVALGGFHSTANSAKAGIIADFSFETSGLAFSTSVTQGASPFGPLAPESGAGSAYGSHAATSAVYSSPAGNGSSHSLSSNNWVSGNYYQFDVSTVGLDDIMISYDQISSATGPKVFDLLAGPSTAALSTIGQYTINITQNDTNILTSSVTGTEASWQAASSGAYNHSFDLSSITAMNNDSNVVFEIADADTTTATGGTNRVDNVIISGDTAAVPEPAELSLLTVAAAGLMFRRRNKGSNPA